MTHRYVVGVRIHHEGQVIYEGSTPADSEVAPHESAELLTDLSTDVVWVILTMIEHAQQGEAVGPLIRQRRSGRIPNVLPDVPREDHGDEDIQHE